MLCFKGQNEVTSSRFHIFLVKYWCLLRTRTGALGGSTILRGQRPIYTYLKLNIDVRKLLQMAPFLKCHSPAKEPWFLFRLDVPCFFPREHFEKCDGDLRDLERIS